MTFVTDFATLCRLMGGEAATLESWRLPSTPCTQPWASPVRARFLTSEVAKLMVATGIAAAAPVAPWLLPLLQWLFQWLFPCLRGCSCGHQGGEGRGHPAGHGALDEAAV